MADTNTCLETKEPKEVSISDIEPNAPKKKYKSYLNKMNNLF